MDIDNDTIAALRERIEAMPAQPRTSPAALIAQLQPTLDDARARGLSFEALMPLLREVGLTLSAKTVRDYMCRARRARRGERAIPHTAPAAPATQAPSSPPASPQTLRSWQRQGSRESHTQLPAVPVDAATGRFELLPDTEKL